MTDIVNSGVNYSRLGFLITNTFETYLPGCQITLASDLIFFRPGRI